MSRWRRWRRGFRVLLQAFGFRPAAPAAPVLKGLPRALACAQEEALLQAGRRAGELDATLFEAGVEATRIVVVGDADRGRSYLEARLAMTPRSPWRRRVSEILVRRRRRQ